MEVGIPEEDVEISPGCHALLQMSPTGTTPFKIDSATETWTASRNRGFLQDLAEEEVSGHTSDRWSTTSRAAPQPSPAAGGASMDDQPLPSPGFMSRNLHPGAGDTHIAELAADILFEAPFSPLAPSLASPVPKKRKRGTSASPLWPKTRVTGTASTTTVSARKPKKGKRRQGGANSGTKESAPGKNKTT